MINLENIKKKTATKSLRQRILCFIILCLIARVTIFARRRSVGAYSIVDVFALAEIILIGIGGFFVLTDPLRKSTFSSVSKTALSFFLLYYGLCMFSAAWSLNMEYTLFRSVEMIILCSVIFLVMNYYDNFISAERAYLSISIISVCFVIIMQLKGSWAFSLGNLHTNQYSAIAAMAFVYCLGEWLNCKEVERKKTLMMFAAFFLFTTLLGTSAASNVAAFAGICMVLAFGGASKVPLMIVMLSGCLYILISGDFVGTMQDILMPGKTEHEIITMTGRTYLWERYIDLFWRRPVNGYGFGIISRLGSRFGIVSTTNTHNGLLEVLLGTGFIGGFLFLCWGFSQVFEIINAYGKKNPGSLGFLGAFTVGMVNNMGRSMIGSSFDAPTTLFIVLLGLFSFHINNQKDKNPGIISNKRVRKIYVR